MLDDLRNIARPIPLERFPVDVDRSVADVVESMQQHAETAGLTLRAELRRDRRVHRGRRVRARPRLPQPDPQRDPGDGAGRADRRRHRGARPTACRCAIYDTGCGIPPDRLGAIFEDFVTTKRRGLGLGLAISKKIVEQLGGQISVTSEVGKGTTFVLDFPRTQARPMLVRRLRDGGQACE